MKKMTKAELVEKAWEQECKMTQLRGYSSGVTKEALAFLFDVATLERLIKKTDKTLKEMESAI